jgi:hypothetical protein
MVPSHPRAAAGTILAAAGTILNISKTCARFNRAAAGSPPRFATPFTGFSRAAG